MLIKSDFEGSLEIFEIQIDARNMRVWQPRRPIVYASAALLSSPTKPINHYNFQSKESLISSTQISSLTLFRRSFQLAFIFLPCMTLYPISWMGSWLGYKNDWWIRFFRTSLENAGPVYVKVSFLIYEPRSWDNGYLLAAIFCPEMYAKSSQNYNPMVLLIHGNHLNTKLRD